MDSFALWSWRKALRISWTFRKMNKWIGEKNKPEASLKAKVTKQVVLLWHIMKS